MKEKKIKPNQEKSRLFPHAHICNTNDFDPKLLVNKLRMTNKAELFRIFENDPAIFRAKNIELGSAIQSLFKNNIVFLCEFYGISRRELFRETTRMGIKGKSQAFIQGNGRKHFSLLYLAMFSKIFNIEAGVLIGIDLREVY